MTKSICIVTHCFCPPGLDIYAEHLRLQWASLVRYPSRADVTLTICCTYQSEDPATWNMIESTTWPARARREFLTMGTDRLFRRAIGRNVVAKRDYRPFDIFWFTDVDYLFGPGCLDAVAAQVGPDDGLCSPKIVNISTTHEIGDHYVEDRKAIPLPDIYPDCFTARRQKIPIGGVQIIGGNVARKIGYCEGSKWIKPVDPKNGFRSCRCDKAFRRLNHFETKWLDIPNLYRLRHSEAGRDRDAAGVKVGKRVW